ncbi:MAG: hypothetical protein ABW162_14145 [Candidatus Sedimenticola sp. PURPLELP]
MNKRWVLAVAAVIVATAVLYVSMNSSVEEAPEVSLPTPLVPAGEKARLGVVMNDPGQAVEYPAAVAVEEVDGMAEQTDSVPEFMSPTPGGFALGFDSTPRGEPVRLWEPAAAGDTPDHFASDMHLETILADPQQMGSISIGQTLELPIPQEGKVYQAMIMESGSLLNGAVKTWMGSFDSNGHVGTLTLVRGEGLTVASLATDDTVYSIEIDNETGLGHVLDEKEQAAYYDNDVIAVSIEEGD